MRSRACTPAVSRTVQMACNVPYWCKEGPKPPPINAKAETVSKLPMFREAYRRRRCIVPVDGFFEWRAEHGAKQPYAIAMQDRSRFGLAGLWENWKDPATAGALSMARMTSPAAIKNNIPRMMLIRSPRPLICF